MRRQVFRLKILMKKINIRGFSTPLIIGAGTFVALTGLIMFFITTDPFRFAHELLGISFAVAIVLHILSNWRPFKRYFSQHRAVIIIALAWLIGISLVATSAFREHADAEEVVVERIEQSSIQLLAPVVNKTPEMLTRHLSDAGYVVDDPRMTLEEIAEQHEVDTEVILLAVFR